LVSQKRRGVQRGGCFILEGGKEQSFDYRGHWCLQIESGEPQDIFVLKYETFGGGTQGNNWLGMV